MPRRLQRWGIAAEQPGDYTEAPAQEEAMRTVAGCQAVAHARARASQWQLRSSKLSHEIVFVRLGDQNACKGSGCERTAVVDPHDAVDLGRVGGAAGDRR